MRLPTQPKTVKPKVRTIANTIQSPFTLASLRRTPRGHPRLEFHCGRGEANPGEPGRSGGGLDDLAVDFPDRVALRRWGDVDPEVAENRRCMRRAETRFDVGQLGQMTVVHCVPDELFLQHGELDGQRLRERAQRSLSNRQRQGVRTGSRWRAPSIRIKMRPAAYDDPR